MLVDFHHHFTPRELIKQDPGDKLILNYDENGAPSYTVHRMLYELDTHIAMMDACGIDLAVLSSAAGMSSSIELSKLVNEKAKQAEKMKKLLEMKPAKKKMKVENQENREMTKETATAQVRKKSFQNPQQKKVRKSKEMMKYWLLN